MQYTYTTRIKRRHRRLNRLSILSGNKIAVKNLLQAVTAYTGKSKTEISLSLWDIEVGNLEDFEKFARVVNYQLADLINKMNRELMRARVKSLTGNNIDEAEAIQYQFTTDFCKFLQKDNDLKNIIVKYLRLVISRLGRSSSTSKVRIARQLKFIQKALIINDWQQFLQISDKINKIENESYCIFNGEK